MPDRRQMKLGLSMRYLGYHLASWRHPESPEGGARRFGNFRDIARRAEAEKLDMVFFADGVGVRADDNPPGALARDMKTVDLEPLTLLAALGASTDRIGLVATASTSYNEPYHIARKYASIDEISGGRAGWNIVTSWSRQEAWNFGRDEGLESDERYERAEEFVEVVSGLWNSWDEDAFLCDRASGQFYDPAGLHVLNHVGKHFRVRGPLNVARSPQGRPLLVQAGASEPGRRIAARFADLVYSAPVGLEDAQAYYADLKSRLPAFGRTADDLLIMPGITVYTGATEAEAKAKFAELQELIHPLIGLQILYSHLGDLSEYDVDGPVPEPKLPPRRSLSVNVLAMARRDNLTIRQLYQRVAAGNSGRLLIGSAEQVVDDLQMWFENGAADGFNLCPPMLPQGMDDLSTFILPELRRRGLFRTEYEAATLRGNLGLRPLPDGSA